MKTKLTEADYEEIREAYYAGESKEDIAKRKNISKYYVRSEEHTSELQSH